MDNRKICFIICYNDDDYLNECILYLRELNIPEGFTIDLLTIAEADSMTAGYNAGMHGSDAKYKIYMHQDVCIINRDFLVETIKIFEGDASVGMIGMVGTKKLPESGVMWESKERIGALRSCHLNTVDDYFDKGHKEVYSAVEAIDGLLMMTQYDVEWREDLFTGWDFYDVSQSFEFRRKGYQVVVPRQEVPWVLHDCGFLNFEKYGHYRDIFCKEYMFEKSEEKLSKEKQQEQWDATESLLEYDREADASVKKINEMISGYIDVGRISLAREMIYQYISKLQHSEVAVKLYILFQIQEEERAENIPDVFARIGTVSTESLLEHFRKLRFYIRRFEYDMAEECQAEAVQYILEKKTSGICLDTIAQFACVNAEDAVKKITEYLN